MTLLALDDSIGLIKKAAVISDCGRYRYELTRVWEKGRPLLVTCMLNPSTADADNDDPTICALIHFGKAWGYGGLLVVNLFAFRSSSPIVMMSSHYPRGPKNVQFIETALTVARLQNTPALAAWGAHGAHHASLNDGEGGQDWFCGRARHQTVDLVCLGLTKEGFPKHPMARGVHRIDRNQQPVMFRRATKAA
ncbi:DUF1643 domain-containing protein [Rhizobium sp. SEMIA 4085]|uniref:DUF1643 domain-containing protein n=1 Tax=Rhizobium gallicum bv. gallicum R602sp TaxID=1041138 RepID=A0A0B4X8R8_9HYPH|nr:MULTISPECIES: DUF1643 domain-containing protein [Rhizobium]AJD42998.1 hypothetical protein RGR602_CH03698 [Rhizobium gallicum bv. gallicum R602sp]NNH31035.1 DUF1643 domain-containing protein [Rhizobium sp. SEMIA 4085]